jgi:hypothetical protein
MNSNAIWFSRHNPTQDQLAQIEAMGLKLCQPMGLGAEKALENKEDVRATLALLSAAARELKADYVFGVFPPALRSIADRRSTTAVSAGDYCHRGLEMMEAWNAMRSPEGGKPTFIHLKWVGTGALPVFKEEEDIAPWVSHL